MLTEETIDERKRLYDLYRTDITRYLSETKDEREPKKIFQITLPIFIKNITDSEKGEFSKWWTPLNGDAPEEISPRISNDTDSKGDSSLQEVLTRVSDILFELIQSSRNFTALRSKLLALGFSASGEDPSRFDFAIPTERVKEIFNNQEPELILAITLEGSRIL